MKAKSQSILFILSILILAACARGTPTPAPIPTGPHTSRPQPSPSAMIPAAAPFGSGSLPATIDSTTSVANDIAPGWVHHESINEILDLAFAPDGGLWAVTTGGLVRWDLDTGTYTRYLLPAYQVVPAPDGTLWLNTEYGLCQFDGTTCEQPPELHGTGDQIYRLAVTSRRGPGFPLKSSAYPDQASVMGFIWYRPGFVRSAKTSYTMVHKPMLPSSWAP